MSFQVSAQLYVLMHIAIFIITIHSALFLFDVLKASWASLFVSLNVLSRLLVASMGNVACMDCRCELKVWSDLLVSNDVISGLWSLKKILVTIPFSLLALSEVQNLAHSAKGEET